MTYQAVSIRTFIGAKDYSVSRAFYRALGFEEVEIDKDMCLYKITEQIGFYLQDYDVADWVNNSMIFLEVDDLEKCEADLKGRNLTGQFAHVRMTGIKTLAWGRELFLHDPSGVLWHFGEFNT